MQADRNGTQGDRKGPSMQGRYKTVYIREKPHAEGKPCHPTRQNHPQQGANVKVGWPRDSVGTVVVLQSPTAATSTRSVDHIGTSDSKRHLKIEPWVTRTED
jgi:hypothetical protein